MDQTTKNKDKLLYARVLMEIQVGQNYPDEVHFMNEKGLKVTQKVAYEWLPIQCSKCHGIGHRSEVCKKNTGKKIWVAKTSVRIEPQQNQQGKVVQGESQKQDDEGFITISGKHGRKTKCDEPEPQSTNKPVIVNRYGVLDDMTTADLFYDAEQRKESGDVAQVDQGREPPGQHG